MKIFKFYVVISIVFSFCIVQEINADHQKYNKSKYQAKFFDFMVGLYKWAAFAKKKHVKDEAITTIYYKTTKDKLEKFGAFLEKNKDLLVVLKRVGDLHRINNKEIMPDPIYRYIAENFGLKNKDEEIKANVFFLKLVGGDFQFRKGKELLIKGFLRTVEEFSMSSWDPVHQFINNFRDTLTLDAHLSEKLGKSMLPLVEKYYDYLDLVSKLRLLSELLMDWKKYNFNGHRENDNNQLALRIFQCSGPIVIKLLQEMQEEIVGETPVTEVLKSLKDSRPMSSEIAKKLTKLEIANVLGRKKINNFKFRSDPLGIASIAQTHLFQYSDELYVVKIQRDRISEVFEREKESISRMIDSESIFDRGLKKRIENANEGILEELDFNNERKNIKFGYKLYTDMKKLIKTVKIPSVFSDTKKLKSNPKVMIMSLAKGEPLGKIMERSIGEEIHKSYHVVHNLYQRFLDVALDGSMENNFYHGDLHRENIFLDLETNEATLIDFGNAGVLHSKMKKNILNVYKNAKKTSASDEKILDQAILDLGSVLQDIVVKQESKSGEGSDVLVRKGLIGTFFKTCFNPNLKLENKIFENKRVGEIHDKSVIKIEELINSKSDPDANFFVINKKIENLKEDISLIKALRNNCLNGPVNRILSTLAQKNIVSEKLRIIFDELQKNGLALPKEMIFFNKSNALLQGIVINLMEIMEVQGYAFNYIDPDAVFQRTISSLTDKQ